MNDKVVDPNEYPKWIDHPTDDVAKTKDGKRIPVRILVKDAKEEALHYPPKEEHKKTENKPAWDKK